MALTFAPGCCSAISPCSHQQQWPDSLCDICRRSCEERDRAIEANALAAARRMLESKGYKITPPNAEMRAGSIIQRVCDLSGDETATVLMELAKAGIRFTDGPPC